VTIKVVYDENRATRVLNKAIMLPQMAASTPWSSSHQAF
jgi:hypothetical protein